MCESFALKPRYSEVISYLHTTTRTFYVQMCKTIVLFVLDNNVVIGIIMASMVFALDR